ncbi:hypothetical protein GEMRC1_007330 [Eukaryota sp. GEM-RC1]
MPDYDTRRNILVATIEQLASQNYLKVISSESVSSLAHVTEGFSSHAIISAATTVLSPTRLKKITSTMPLNPHEIIEVLVEFNPLAGEEYAAFRAFLQKIPSYASFAPPKVEDENEEEGKKKDGAKKGKKKK